MKPRIYIAGKIEKNCWRHSLIDNLRDHSWNAGDLEQEDWINSGPFFTSCDHGCFHQPTLHGALPTEHGCASSMTRSELLARIEKAIESSDAIFAYINSMDCYGTHHEIGYAHMAKKPIYIVYGSKVNKEELWIQAESAESVMEIHSFDELKEKFDFVKSKVRENGMRR